jgi:glutathione synthase/RimK-type ligase-like ATP-grasp enzyme
VGSASRAGSSGPGDQRFRLAIATCGEVPDLDDEGRLLLTRLRAAGVEAEPAIWDDESVRWDDYDRVLLRSTWDYPRSPESFAAWVAARGRRLINPPEVVLWNISKRYLALLESWGLPIVPTDFIAPGEPVELPGETEFVVKPAVSAGSRGTARYAPDDLDRAHRHVAELLAANREVMIQPYLPSVETAGETAVIMLGGRFSHAMRKGPLLELEQEPESGLFREEEMSRRHAAEDEIELAERVLDRYGAEIRAPTYARIDLLRSAAGAPLILELELIEPSLFLDHHPDAADRLAELLSAADG